MMLGGLLQSCAVTIDGDNSAPPRRCLPGGDFRWYQEQVLQAACLQIKSGFAKLSDLCDALIFLGQGHRWAWVKERSP